LADAWQYKTGYLAPNPAQMSGPNFFPTSLFNGMVHPLTNMPVKGVIWYQGENNTNRSAEYASNLQTLIKDWRRYWKDNELPFLVVQLPNYNEDDAAKKYWKEMRAAQQQATNLTNVGIVVTYDIGDSSDVHPVNKYDVGKRLALLARKMVYRQSNIVAEGPKASRIYAEGEKVILQFDIKNRDEQLTATDKYGYPKGFEIAGADKQFHFAYAQISGEKILLSAREVTKPKYVRYAWAENPDANLFNVYGLPAAPFVADVQSAK
jgi:sialate O-acetylesterase